MGKETKCPRAIPAASDKTLLVTKEKTILCAESPKRQNPVSADRKDNSDNKDKEQRTLRLGAKIANVARQRKRECPGCGVSLG